MHPDKPSSPTRPSFTLPATAAGVFLPALILLLVAVHLVLLVAGGPVGAPWYYQTFGLSLHEFSHGKMWQLLSYALLHSDGMHLGINLLVLCLVGTRVLRILGAWNCGQIILGGILGGGLFHLCTGILLLRTGYADTNLVGISGACFALLLALTTLSPSRRFRLLPVSGKNLGLGIIIAELLFWLMHPGIGLPVFSYMGELMIAWAGQGLFRISHACHLGGAVAGWLLARRLLAPLPERGEPVRS